MKKKINFNKVIDQIQNVRKKTIKTGWIFCDLLLKVIQKKLQKY